MEKVVNKLGPKSRFFFTKSNVFLGYMFHNTFYLNKVNAFKIVLYISWGLYKLPYEVLNLA